MWLQKFHYNNYNEYVILYKDIVNQCEVDITQRNHSYLTVLALKVGIFLLLIFGLMTLFYPSISHNQSIIGFLLHHGYLMITIIMLIVHRWIYILKKYNGEEEYFMEKIVGKPKLKSALLYTSFTVLAAWFLFDSNVWQGMRIFALVLVIIAFVMILPGIGYCQMMWKVDEHHLSYTYHYTFLDKIISFYQFLWHHKHLYQMTLRLNQIDYINVTYSAVPRFPFGGIGYDLLFETQMFDGSIYTFEALVTRDRKAFCEAVSFIQSHGIEFNDSFKILEYLKTGKPLNYYLEELEANHD